MAWKTLRTGFSQVTVRTTSQLISDITTKTTFETGGALLLFLQEPLRIISNWKYAGTSSLGSGVGWGRSRAQLVLVSDLPSLVSVNQDIWMFRFDQNECKVIN